MSMRFSQASSIESPGFFGLRWTSLNRELAADRSDAIIIHRTFINRASG
jgi:hypothetical protein